MAKFQNAIHKLKQQCCNKLTTKSYQLKIHRTKDDDPEEVVRQFYKTETQSVLDRLKPIEDQWKSLDLWELVQYVNPRPVLEFVQKPLHHKDKQLTQRTTDRPNAAFRRSIVICCIFEDLMRNLGWTVGDSLDIEIDICNIVGNMMMQLAEQDRSSLLDCMQSAIINISAQRSKRDSEELRSLLIKKKKYNSLNMACILLEQMILDNKDNNVSWMRTVCTQFIELVVQLIIEPEYQENIRWTLNSLMKLEPYWSVADIYNLMRDGIFMFQYRHDFFNRYLTRIQDMAVVSCSTHRQTACLLEEHSVLS